jgi:hypothetical protein
MKKGLAGCLCLMVAGSVAAATVGYNTTGDWSSQTVEDVDTVVINADAVITVDQSDTMAILRVNNQDSPATGTLNISGNHTLNATSFIQLGTKTGSGIVTQSTGSVTTPILVINNSGAGDLSRYDLSGGSVSASTRIDVNNLGVLNVSGGSLSTSALNVYSGGSANLTGGTSTLGGASTIDGALTVNGGILTFDTDGDNDMAVSGAGTLVLQSGTLNTTATAAGDLLTLNADVAISGGAVDLNGQIAVGQEFRVDGTGAASINLERISGTSDGTFKFVFAAEGVDTIQVDAWMTLGNASLDVDGTAYAGSETSFVLLDAVNNTANFASYNVTGFGTEGVDWEIVQTLGSGTSADVVLNIIPEPATIGMLGLGGLLTLFVRRYLRQV